MPEFVNLDGLTCLIKVGAEADQNYQNYILRGWYGGQGTSRPQRGKLALEGASWRVCPGYVPGSCRTVPLAW